MAKKSGARGLQDDATATEMRVESVAIESISQDPANARKHDERNLEAIKASLRRFGQQTPIVVDASGVVRKGNGTLEAARALGWDEIKIVRTRLQGSEATAYVIADNRTSDLSEFDDDVLAATLQGLVTDDETLLEACGYDEDELADLLESMELDGDGTAGEVIEDEVPEPPADPITKPGDLWILGRHRLLCGDSTKAEDVGRLMDGAKADLCFTSPPYNAGNSKTGAYGGGSARRSDFKKMYNHDLDDMTSDQYKKFLFAVLDLISDNTKDSACVLWNVAYNATSRREFGEIAFGHQTLKVQETIVWDKTIGMNVCANNIYSRSAEFVFLLSKSEKYKSNQSGGVYWNIWRISPRDGDNMQNGHGASFPVKLSAKGIEQHSVIGDIAYEPFCGSGTTLIASEQLNRTCYGMEISPAYCDVIVKRWENLTGEKAKLA